MRTWTSRCATVVAAVVAGACALAGAGGCGGDFDPYNRLTSLRILAIKSYPVAPASGEATMLSAFVYTPPAPQVTPLTYAWSWCPFVGGSNDGYKCQVSEETLSAAAGRPVSFDLGGGETAKLTNDLDPALFETICAGSPNLPPPPDCDTGFPVTVMLTVSTPDDQVMAIRTLRLRFRDNQEANANPSLGELYAEVADTHMTISDPPASDTTLPRNVSTDIFATIPDGPAPDPIASETYNGKDDNGQPAVKREHLTLSWFVETGDTRLERTSFLDGFTTLENAGKNKWTPQTKKKYDPDTSKLIVIIRDDRNGVDWSSGTVHLEPSP